MVLRLYYCIRVTIRFKKAVIEKESLGGVCLNWGCIPTKALLKSAQVFDYINHAQDFGISVDNPSIDFPSIKSRDVVDISLELLIY